MQVSELSGQTLGDNQYRLLTRLGGGNFGTVYRAEELMNGAVAREALAVVPSGVVDLVVNMLAGTTLPTDWEWVPRAAAGLLATAAASTVAVSVALTSYVHLRCRREGWDLMSRMVDEFPSAPTTQASSAPWA